jgi:uncharacterized protein (TIGR02453 family)
MSFTGFPADALAFYEGLEADNSKSYWQANKHRYDSAVRGPMEALCETLDAEFGPLKVFRPNRDVRFSADKTPYKTHIGASGEGEGGAMYYVQFSSTGLFAASGYYMMATDQLARFREAIVDDRLGREIESLVDGLIAAKYSVESESLKTAPRGYPKDHPRIELLRRKWLTMGKTFPPAKWMHTKAAADRVRAVWHAAAPLNEWLDAHVGPSTILPADFDKF